MTRSDTRLVLIRHGESVAQVERFLSGHDTCRGLSDRGRGQAGALRDRFVASGELRPVDTLYTSNLRRAVETAEILAPALDGPAPVAECDWCELRAGAAEGLTWDELETHHPPPVDRDDPFCRWIPGAETWAEFFVRAGARLRRVAHEHAGERVVVVGHGGIVGASFVALADASMRDGIALCHETRNTSITEWRWTGRRWRLVRFNDAAHLASG